jgi:hypothetical protein
MNRVKTHGLTVLVLMAPWGPLVAHHGTAGSYDDSKVVTIQGTVKEFRWRNPHSALFLVGKDESGKQVTYALEMGSPVTLVRLGYSRDTFKVGDQAVMDMHPSFTNPVNGYAPTSLRAEVNGKVLRSGKSE